MSICFFNYFFKTEFDDSQIFTRLTLPKYYESKMTFDDIKNFVCFN